MAALSLEQFVNSIRNMYHSQQQQQQTSPTSHQTLDQQNRSATTSTGGPINYAEIFNTINSNLEVLSENANNLIDNVLPVFTLPEYTLPNMAVLYTIVTSKVNEAELTRSNATNTVNQEKILNEVENCIKFAEEKQVEELFFLKRVLKENKTRN